jgi:hypothetical protein
MSEIEIDRTAVARPAELVGFRLSWGGIWAGIVVAVAVQILLALLGLAIGFGAWHPGASAGGYGWGAAIWAIVSAIISLFLGGLVAGRLAGILTIGDGVLHGIVMWGLATVFMAWLVTNSVGTVLGGALGFVSRTTASAVGGAAGGAATSTRGMSQAELQRIVHDVRRALDTTQTTVASRARADSSYESAGEVAEQTTTVASVTAWIALGALILSLGAAMWGAAITARH